VRGFAHGEEDVVKSVPAIEKALEAAAKEGVGDRRQLEELIARAIAQWAWRTHRRNPIVLPAVIEE
jgi:ribonuclease J